MSITCFFISYVHYSTTFLLLAGMEVCIFLALALWLQKRIHYNDVYGPNFFREYRFSEIKSSVFLVGDMGAVPTDFEAPIVTMLKEQLPECNIHSALVFLGDNIYPHGMPKENDSGRARAEKLITEQMNIAHGYQGHVVIISGNHDWNKGRKNGWEYMKREEDFVNHFFKNDNTYLPHNGCPGPDCIELNDDLTLIIINTQWWVQRGFVPIGNEYGCAAQSEEDFFRLLKNCLDANKEKKILVIAHHPLYSNSAHGGKFSTKQHLFPLTAFNKKLMVPIPLAGSLYPIYRKYFGAREDMSYPEYRRMRKKLLKQLEGYPGLMYAAGHEHNLQYIKKKEKHFLISGSGSKTAYVRQGGKAEFTASNLGFLRLNFLYNGEVWLEAFQADKHKQAMIFTTLLN